MAGSLRVLIVDEDLDSRVAARKALQRATLAVAGETGFGNQAVSLALETTPDLILVCVEEPVARPLETAEALANAVPDTPIVIYSSAADAGAIRRGMVFGARDYLLKPLQAAQLREALGRALEQEERRQMRRAGQLSGEAGRGTVIVVTGAKGGIGKTVISVNLAVALRLETGKSVALVDADTQFGDVSTLLDLSPVVTVADVLRYPDRFDRAGASGFMAHHSSGIDALLTPRDDDPWTAAGVDAWRRIMDTLAQLYEFVVVDTSGAFDAFVRRAVESSSLVLVVTTAEVSSVRDTGAAVRRLNAWDTDMTRVRIVFNRGARAGGVGKNDLEAAVGHKVFWEVPHDKAVPGSVQVGRPVAMNPKNAGLGQNMRALARLIAGTKRSLVAGQSKPSLLRRLIPNRGRYDDSAMANSEPAGQQRKA